MSNPIRPEDLPPPSETPDAADLEAALLIVEDIASARIVTGDEGAPVSLHLSVVGDRPAAEIISEVEAVYAAGFEYAIDPRLIAVSRAEADTPLTLPRIKLVAIEAAVARHKHRVTVDLDQAGKRTRGECVDVSPLYCAAEATRLALVGLSMAARGINIQHAAVVNGGPNELALICARFRVESSDEVLCGIAKVRERGAIEATARATLEAVNRRLPMLTRSWAT